MLMSRVGAGVDAVDGGGGGGTGVTAASSAAAAAPARNRFQGGAASAIQFSVVVPADGGGAPNPKCAPSLSLPHGSIVEVMALPGNHGIAYSALTPSGAKASGSRAVHGVGYAAQSYRNIHNLSEVWVYADTVGDGVQIRVTPGRG